MNIVYYYNSGFSIAQNDILLIFDYIRDRSVKDSITPEYLQHFDKVCFFTSHSHSDHFDPVILQWQEHHDHISYFISDDIRNRVRHKSISNVVFLSPGDKWQDGNMEVTAYGSTDKGVSFHVILDGISLFHAGDLNYWHWKQESTEKEINDAKDAFTRILDQLAAGTGRLDIAMFPVDPRMGRDFHEGADIFIDRFDPGLFVPMHFQKAFRAVDEFIRNHPDKEKAIWRIQSPGDSIDFSFERK